MVVKSMIMATYVQGKMMNHVGNQVDKLPVL